MNGLLSIYESDPSYNTGTAKKFFDLLNKNGVDAYVAYGCQKSQTENDTPDYIADDALVSSKPHQLTSEEVNKLYSEGITYMSKGKVSKHAKLNTSIRPAIAIQSLFGKQAFINKHSWLQGHDGFVMLLGLGQVQSQVDVFAPNNGHMLVLEELDVAGSHEAIDHEADKPMQVRIDHAMPFKNLTAAAVFLREHFGHGFTNPLPCKTHKVSIFGNGKTAPRLVGDFNDRKLW